MLFSAIYSRYSFARVVGIIPYFAIHIHVLYEKTWNRTIAEKERSDCVRLHFAKINLLRVATITESKRKGGRCLPRLKRTLLLIFARETVKMSQSPYPE